VNVVFDMDGALLRLDVDLEEVRTRLAALFAPRGVTRPFRPVLRRLREAAREVGDAALEAAGLAILSEWEARGAADARARDGAAGVLAALVARGDRAGLVTDAGRAAVALALPAAGLDPRAFSAVVTRDDLAAPKPDPEGLRRAAAALAPGVTWYVVDHPREAETGRAAGLRVAGVLGSGTVSAADLTRAGAERVLGGLTGVLTLGA
jgi:phosphoglycolate phosphatase-like HAD superfamily hydrolase